MLQCCIAPTLQLLWPQSTGCFEGNYPCLPQHTRTAFVTPAMSLSDLCLLSDSHPAQVHTHLQVLLLVELLVVCALRGRCAPQNDILFGLPVVLDTDSEDYAVGDQVLLQYQGQDLAVFTVESKWVPNKPLEAKHLLRHHLHRAPGRPDDQHGARQVLHG